MKTLFYFLCGLVVLPLLFAGCRKDDDDIGINCDGEAPVSADFAVAQNLSWGNDTAFVGADTFLKGSLIRFRADRDLDCFVWPVQPECYRWQIGTDPRIYHDRSVELLFNITGPVTATLTVDREPDPECFPNDDGRDTVRKTIYFAPRESSPLYGIYTGFCESEPEEVVNLEIFSSDGFSFEIKNFPDGDCPYSFSIIAGYRYFFMPEYLPAVHCYKPKGWGRLSADGRELTVEYEVWDPEREEKVSDVFFGIKN